jgi:hypothetical protein
MLTVEDGVVAAMFSDGGESGGAPATRGMAPEDAQGQHLVHGKLNERRRSKK